MSKLGKEGQNGYLEVVKSLNDKIATVPFFFKLERKKKRGGTSSSRFRFLEREA